MKKIISLLLMISGIFFVFSPQASADTVITDVYSGTRDYYVYPKQDYLGQWGVYWETRSNIASNSAGSGASVLKINSYFTKQNTAWGDAVDGDIVHKGTTVLVDSYNNKSYSYNTLCDLLYNEQKLTMNKTVGWSTSKNPYITYPLKPGACYGGNYINVNHVFVNET